MPRIRTTLTQRTLTTGEDSGILWPRPSAPCSKARLEIGASRPARPADPISISLASAPDAPPTERAACLAPAPVAQRAVDIFLRYLKAEGVRVVFGIPGGLIYPFFDTLERDGEIRVVVAKHEEGAAFMADGYARAGRCLGVCAATSGPGATNLITGVACAFADGVPLLVITGQAASHALGKGAAQETAREDIDIVAMFRPITKYSAMVTSPASLTHHLRRALRLALTGRQGPVHLNVPVDFWEKPIDEGDEWLDPRAYRPETTTCDRAAIARAAALLLEARRPVILAGSGVACAGAEQPLAALAQLLGARVATTPRAKGVFPEDDPRALGVLGVAGHREARETLLGDEVDVLLAVGTSLGETSTFNWNPRLRPSRALLQVDIDPDRIGRNYPVDVPLVGDARRVLEELVEHIDGRLRGGPPAGSEWEEDPISRRSVARYEDPAQRVSDALPLTPQRWRADLEEVLPDDALVFSDIGGHMLFNIHHLRIRAGQRFFINLGFGSMGHGVVAPIGAALAEPSRPVITIVGDGGFAMNGMDLLAAVEHDANVLWIVENNNMHGITWHCSKLLSGGRPLRAARYRHSLEIASMARAMGLPARVVDSPGQMQAAVREALARGGPGLIEVRVDGGILPPLGERTRSLAGFIEK
jgi:acetolactate synthase I/II/III large subunit